MKDRDVNTVNATVWNKSKCNKPEPAACRSLLDCDHNSSDSDHSVEENVLQQELRNALLVVDQDQDNGNPPQEEVHDNDEPMMGNAQLILGPDFQSPVE